MFHSISPCFFLTFPTVSLNVLARFKVSKLNKIISDDEDCPECDEILEQLEEIDGEADLFGIDFVKICSVEAAAEHGVLSLPALMYFRKQTPMIYDGDLTQAGRILDWLTSQDVFEIKNEIEEVNRKMLDKLLDENDFVTVFFCKLKFYFYWQ